MDYVTLEDLYVCWENQLKKASREQNRRTLFLCEFDRPASMIERQIDSAPAHFSQHGYSANMAVLFSTEPDPDRAALAICAYFENEKIPCALSGISYSGTSPIDVESKLLLRVSIEKAFEQLRLAPAHSTPIVSELTELVRAA